MTDALHELHEQLRWITLRHMIRLGGIAGFVGMALWNSTEWKRE